ncbi:hypothetical protein L3Q67_45425 (plasmid) [Saccharothrix sp. AJ9571]|nr:hypothetical protein L3Q67_45425 [Saccharothrix sp. AJ9571]
MRGQVDHVSVGQLRAEFGHGPAAAGHDFALLTRLQLFSDHVERAYPDPDQVDDATAARMEHAEIDADDPVMFLPGALDTVRVIGQLFARLHPPDYLR